MTSEQKVAIAAVLSAAQTVNDRYIGGSAVKGKLGEAIEKLAAVIGKHRAALLDDPAGPLVREPSERRGEL